LLEP